MGWGLVLGLALGSGLRRLPKNPCAVSRGNRPQEGLSPARRHRLQRPRAGLCRHLRHNLPQAWGARLAAFPQRHQATGPEFRGQGEELRHVFFGGGELAVAYRGPGRVRGLEGLCVFKLWVSMGEEGCG